MNTKEANKKLTEINVHFIPRTNVYRCTRCWKLQRLGTLLAWIPDGWMVGDSWEALVDSSKQGFTTSSGWCPTCTYKLLPSSGVFNTIIDKAAAYLTK